MGQSPQDPPRRRLSQIKYQGAWRDAYDATTEERVSAKLGEWRAERVMMAAKREEAKPSGLGLPELPRGSMSRNDLLEACAITAPALFYHRKKNTCGIDDAAFYLPRSGPGRPAVCFWKREAGPFVDFMQAKARHKRWPGRQKDPGEE